MFYLWFLPVLFLNCNSSVLLVCFLPVFCCDITGMVDRAWTIKFLGVLQAGGRLRVTSVNSSESNPDRASAEHMSDSSSSEAALVKR